MLRTGRVTRSKPVPWAALSAAGALLAACASLPAETAYSARPSEDVRACLDQRLGAAGAAVAVVGTDRRGYALAPDVRYDAGMSWTEGTRIEVHSDRATPSPAVSDAIAACA